jgi:hypothetical protein
VSFRIFSINPLCVAVYLVMHAHDIPGMKRKKMENGLVTAMINDYMAATTSASSQRLASYLGDYDDDVRSVSCFWLMHY